MQDRALAFIVIQRSDSRLRKERSFWFSASDWAWIWIPESSLPQVMAFSMAVWLTAAWNLGLSVSSYPVLPKQPHPLKTEASGTSIGLCLLYVTSLMGCSRNEAIWRIRMSFIGEWWVESSVLSWPFTSFQKRMTVVIISEQNWKQWFSEREAWSSRLQVPEDVPYWHGESQIVLYFFWTIDEVPWFQKPISYTLWTPLFELTTGHGSWVWAGWGVWRKALPCGYILRFHKCTYLEAPSKTDGVNSNWRSLWASDICFLQVFRGKWHL